MSTDIRRPQVLVAQCARSPVSCRVTLDETGATRSRSILHDSAARAEVLWPSNVTSFPNVASVNDNSIAPCICNMSYMYDSVNNNVQPA